MKKKTINKITLFTALGLGVVLLASCTANLSTTKDKANILFTYDMGTTRYSKTKPDNWKDINSDFKHEYTSTGSGETIYTWQDVTKDYQYGHNNESEHVARIFNVKDSQSVYYSAVSSGIKVPALNFWFEFDKKVLNDCWKEYYKRDLDPATDRDFKVENIIDVLNIKGGQVKFSGGTNNNFTYFDNTTQKIKEEIAKGTVSHGSLTVDQCPGTDFTTVYKNYLNNKVNNIRSCIAIYGGEYGNFGWNHNKVTIEAKSWGYAWGKGVISGLVVFPIAWLTETMSKSFGMNGWGQLGAILCVTFIVRTFLLLVSLRSTIGQQKMQMLQPELNKIQAKYPNANTNMAQKQRLSQEQMALYKKNKINPLGTLLVLVVQFPLFIGVWGAMQGSASLATDKVMNLYLSDSIWTTLQQFGAGWYGNTNGCWTAFVLIILMSVGQFISMKLPQWMQKSREKKQPKLTANPAQTKSQKQMKWFGYIMLVMIIIMGFTLPAGMGVYWLAGALFSIVQTLVMQWIIGGQFKQFGRWCKATWIKFISLFKKKEQN